ncbi:ABC transporter permease [Rhodococcus sp. TAF43]|uniref:ABC transporter permease n=1 Tax=unclassified Rhodococcus (in: high G+C Gram-positive bacteria) TaxID=192944 RepID=UPI0015824E57|nr:ABC transporter permease [Rhodococcus sp. W8901]QKT13404.1 ABC transporter permease [Rhodococcus sp. W8901]
MSNLTHPDLNDPEQAIPAAAQGAAVIVAEPPTPDTVPGTTSERRDLYVRGGTLLAIGVIALGFALGAGPVVMTLRVIVGIIGLIGIYMGFRRIGLAKFGGDFDLTFVLSCMWLVFIVGIAILAPLLPLAEYKDTKKTLSARGFAPPNLFSDHPLGTNNFGLDMLARSIYGARSSLVVAVTAVLIGIIIGGAIGILAGYFGGVVDSVIGVLTNSLLAVPALILLIALAAVLEPSLMNISFALSVLAIPSMIRIARANTLTFSQREFVLAARAMGATRWRVMVRELAPNVALPLASLGMVMISVLIVAEASLSFLGLGIQPPIPTWGNMIAEGQGGVLEKHAFIVFVPGMFLFLTVFSFNIVGEKAQKATGGSREAKL